MVNGISNNTYVYNGNEYRRRSQGEAEVGFWIASLAAAGIRAMLPSFSKPFLKQMPKEHANNHLYKDVFEKTINMSGLKEKGLEYIDVSKYRIKGMDDIVAGYNACYVPDSKKIILNGEKATISGFHELGHAMNHLNGGFGKFLQKLRKPGMWLAGIMGTIAFVGSNKPKGAKKDLRDKIVDNSGLIAFGAMMPIVAEESLASYKGVKIAKKAGLSDALIKNLKKFYGKALLSYAGYAAVTGLSVFAASKLMSAFTRPEKINGNY